MFNDMSIVKMGGNLDHHNAIIDYFDGILAGELNVIIRKKRAGLYYAFHRCLPQWLETN
jgi:hypothetical protein